MVVFTHAACSREQERVVQAVLVQAVDQGLRDMFLPNQLFKGFRAPFARKDLVAHRGV